MAQGTSPGPAHHLDGAQGTGTEAVRLDPPGERPSSGRKRPCGADARREAPEGAGPSVTRRPSDPDVIGAPVEPEDLSAERAERVIAMLVAELVDERARQLVRHEIDARRLVEREEGQRHQPTAAELMRAMLGAIERLASTPDATAVGAHMVALRECRRLLVHGAREYPTLRRSRAQAAADKKPARPREGTNRIPRN